MEYLKIALMILALSLYGKFILYDGSVYIDKQIVINSENKKGKLIHE